MNEVQLRELVTQSLDLHGEERWSLRSGTVLYSDLASIRPGPFYLMGINPGGKPQSDPREAIVCNLAAPDGMNCYADQCWRCCRSPYECEHCDGGRLRPDERDPMQRRVCNLFDALQESPKDVLSTNLIFARSAELSKLQGSKAKWRHRCWSVHQELLRAVRPKWIITLGFGEVFSALRARGTEIRDQQAIPDGSHSVAWHLQLALDLGNGDSHEVGVLGVAHPGNRGFSRAGLSGSERYPEALKRFVVENLLTGNLA